MRQAVLVTTVRKYLYPFVLTVIVILLVLLGSFQSEQVKVKGEETQNNDQATGLADETKSSQDYSTQSVGTPNDSDNSFDTTTSKSFHLSINTTSEASSSTTSGSINFSTNDGDDQSGNILDECLENGDVEIDKDGTEIDCEWNDETLNVNFSSDNDQSTKNKVSNELKVKVKHESD